MRTVPRNRPHVGKPIYRESVQLTKIIVEATKKADRGLRFTVGEYLIKAAAKVTMDFYDAYNENDNEKKIEKIDFVVRSMEQLGQWLDVTHELGFFSYKSFPAILEKYDSVDRQLHGWRNSIAKVPVINGDEQKGAL